MNEQLNIDNQEKEIRNTVMLWKCYFHNIHNQYSEQFKIMLPEEQNNIIEILTIIFLEYKNNPIPQDMEKQYEINPFYRFTNNKKPLNLINLSLKEVF